LKLKPFPRGIKFLIAALGALVALGLTLVLVAVKVLDNDDYQALAAWGVERLAGCRLVVDGTFAVEWSRDFQLTASNVRFEPLDGVESPALRSIGKMHTRVALAPLLRGILLVRNLEIEALDFVQDRREDDRQPSQWPGWLFMPVVERVVLDGIRVRFSTPKAKGTQQVILQRLTLDDIGNRGFLFLEGHGRLNDADFRMTGRLGGTFKHYARNRPFPIDLEFTIADLQARLTGSIDHPIEGRDINLRLSIDEQELANLPKLFQHDVPPLGRFSVDIALTGDVDALQINNLDLQLSNGTSIQMTAAGSVPDLATGRGTEVAISQQIEDSSLLTWLFPDDWQVVEELSLQAALRNVDGHYRIENMEARVANDQGIVLKIDGALDLGNPFEGSPLTAVDLKLHISSPDTAGIKPFLTDAIPEIGGVVGQARLVGPIANLALEDLLVERGGSGPVQVTTRGRIGRIPLAEDEPLENIDFAVSIQAENSKILREFYEIPLGELGSVNLSGRIVGSSQYFKLQEVELDTRTAEGLEAHVRGGIDFAPREDGGVTGKLGFKLRFESPTLGIAEPLLGVSIMGPLGPIRGEADVTGTTEEMTFENILVSGGEQDRLHAEWRGRIDSIPLVEGGVSSGYETYGTLYAARSSDFAALFDIALPDVGPLWGNWRDTDREGVIGMADIQVAVGDGKTFDLQANGKIDNLVDQNKFATAEEEEIEYEGVDFQFDLSTTDSHGIAKLIGLSLPDLGPVRGSWRLTGGESGLTIQNIKLASTSPGGLVISVAGGVPHIDVNPGGGVHAIDLEIKARAPDVGAIPWFEKEAPVALGAFEASAQLVNRSRALDLEDIRIRTGSANQPTLVIAGRLIDIDDLQRTRLEATFTSDARPWLERIGYGQTEVNPRLTGEIEMGRTDKQLRIEKIQAKAEEWGGMTIEGAGTVSLTDASPRVDLQIRSEAADPAAWGQLADLPLPALAAMQITGWYREEENQHQFSGDVRIGESRFQTDFKATTHSGRPVIEASMGAQTLRLQDLGFYSQGDKATPSNTQSDQPATGPLFSEQPLPLLSFNEIDLAFKLRADEIIARENILKEVGLDLTIRDGRLQIGPTTLKYLNGSSTLDAYIDTNESPPALALNMTVEDADIEELLSSLNRPLVLGGQLTMLVDLHSSGQSAREIAANLEGEAGFVIEGGRVQRRIELLASDALDFLFTGAARKTFTDLNCAAFRMFFQNGLGRIQVFFVDTPGMRAEAFGQIDLADETMAMIINPTSKRRLLFRRGSPIRIRGPLRDPSILKVPAQEAAILAGQVLVPVVALPAAALGYLWSLVSRDDMQGSCFIPPEDAP
jgi:uncharacterized protein involved in outer membrane biogenesis